MVKKISEDVIIWNRSKVFVGSPYIKKSIIGDLNKNDYERILDFYANEWKTLYRLISTIYAKNTINNPFTSRSMNKMFQQLVAKRIGFFVPTTIVTNKKERALEFYNEETDLIIKSFSGGRVRAKESEEPPYYGLMTQKVSQKDLICAKDEELSCVPHMFQENIEKKYEQRIVAVGDHVFAFNIFSQDKEYAKIDWRYGNYTVKFVHTSIHDEMRDRIKSFFKEFDLFHGHFDFIVDKSDDVWFLECNQDGQWGWLDNIVDGAISDAYAEEFRKLLTSSKSETSRVSKFDPLEGVCYAR